MASVPANVDPALVLIAKGVDVLPDDELHSVETSGNAEDFMETDRDGLGG